MSEQLLVGQAVELEIEDAATPLRLVGVVLAMPPREILLSLANGVVAPPSLQAGSMVGVRFATTQGLHQGRTTALRVAPGRTVSVALARFANVRISQRRQFFRATAALPTHIEVIAPPTALAREDPRALTQDLSAGGIRVETTLPLAMGDEVRATIQVPRNLRNDLPDFMRCRARVVRVEPVMRRNRKLTSVGLEFIFATEGERDRWVQLAFDLQRGVRL